MTTLRPSREFCYSSSQQVCTKRNVNEKIASSYRTRGKNSTRWPFSPLSTLSPGYLPEQQKTRHAPLTHIDRASPGFCYRSHCANAGCIVDQVDQIDASNLQCAAAQMRHKVVQQRCMRLLVGRPANSNRPSRCSPASHHFYINHMCAVIDKILELESTQSH